jgi:hypothetical protein
MVKKSVYFTYLLLLILSIFFIIKFYFSEENIKTSYKSESLLNLPLLPSDTDDIIEHSDDVDLYKSKQKKYYFEDLIKESR